MFIDGLLRSRELAPDYWKSYVLGTFLRAVSMGREDIIDDWTAAVGGTEIYYSPPNDNTLSGCGIVRDEFSAVIAFQGTDSNFNLMNQVLQSPQAPFDGLTGTVNAYYGACFFERKAAFQNVINALPTDFQLFFLGHSAGGAIAHVAYRWFDHHVNFRTRGCITFGQPRAGNPRFCTATTSPFLRWIAQDDSIPGLPPNEYQAFGLIGSFAGNVLGLNYRHARDGWVMLNNGTIRPGSSSIVDHWGPIITNGYLRLRDAWPILQNSHGMRNYLILLRALTELQGAPISMGPYWAMNSQMG